MKVEFQFLKKKTAIATVQIERSEQLALATTSQIERS